MASRWRLRSVTVSVSLLPESVSSSEAGGQSSVRYLISKGASISLLHSSHGVIGADVILWEGKGAWLETQETEVDDQAQNEDED